MNRTRCSNCNRRLGQREHIKTATSYSGETRKLTVTRSVVKVCWDCGKEQRVKPIETLYEIVIKENGDYEVLK